MTKEEFDYLSADGKTKIHAVKWLPEEEPIAVLQIAHGVTEHILRYEEMAQYFTQRGFVVVGNDHLGHGTSIGKDAQPMYFGTTGSWNWVVKDLETCRKLVKKQYPGIPYIVLGFSLGSFAVRTWLIRRPGNVDAAILAGTGQTPPLSIGIAQRIAKNEAKKAGEEYATPMIDKLTFQTYNKKFAPNRTPCDWLCASETSLDAYMSDPLRGEAFSAGLFRELLSGMAFTGKLRNQKQMDKDMPILLISGEDDPVGDFSKGVRRTESSFKKAGMQDVEMRLYPKLRHDILHEDCREEIYAAIWQWIKNKVKLQ